MTQNKYRAIPLIAYLFASASTLAFGIEEDDMLNHGIDVDLHLQVILQSHVDDSLLVQSLKRTSRMLNYFKHESFISKRKFGIVCGATAFAATLDIALSYFWEYLKPWTDQMSDYGISEAVQECHKFFGRVPATIGAFKYTSNKMRRLEQSLDRETKKLKALIELFKGTNRLYGLLEASAPLYDSHFFKEDLFRGNLVNHFQYVERMAKRSIAPVEFIVAIHMVEMRYTSSGENHYIGYRPFGIYIERFDTVQILQHAANLIKDDKELRSIVEAKVMQPGSAAEENKELLENNFAPSAPEYWSQHDLWKKEQ